MRVAVMSDIHGFSLALDAVIADLEATGPYDLVIVAGDLCEVGPDPAGVVARLWARPRWIVLKGNTDDDIVMAAETSQEWFPGHQIGPEGVRWLSSLPLTHRVQPPGEPAVSRSLLVAHANPHDLRGRLDPAASDAELREVLGGASFGTLAFGHVHISYQRELDGHELVDVSAVGNPKDGDLRCRYGVFTWEPTAGRWRSEIRRLPYPLDATLAQIRASDLPDPDKVARVLQRASY